MKKFTSPSQYKGSLGETIACNYLIRQGFTILERNYTKKWGEIDIIARHKDITHFIEVKTVSCEIAARISHETAKYDAYRPEDQLHTLKRNRLMRTIRIYLANSNVRQWQFDLACVYFDEKARRAQIKLLADIVLGSW